MTSRDSLGSEPSSVIRIGACTPTSYDEINQHYILITLIDVHVFFMTKTKFLISIKKAEIVKLFLRKFKSHEASAHSFQAKTLFNSEWSQLRFINCDLPELSEKCLYHTILRLRAVIYELIANSINGK